MFETHPYLVRDYSDRRSAIGKVPLPGDPSFSEPLARKRIIGQKAKREDKQGQQWYEDLHLDWRPGSVRSWVQKFGEYLDKESLTKQYNPKGHILKEAQSLREIGDGSKGFVGYIYVDGNNMGKYIQKIRTPEEYMQFSEHISQATEYAVYRALAQHLNPRYLKDLNDPETEGRQNIYIHPFEILFIGGDDVLLIVPADKALEIAQTIGTEFEKQLLAFDPKRYADDQLPDPDKPVHRYLKSSVNPPARQCKLSTSLGVLITADATPIYYAEKLTEQLLKSAKDRAKRLKTDGYLGGTVDFQVMKSVTMISSDITSFREQGLTKKGHPTLKLYAAPYTLCELGGLLETVKAFKQSEFPRSQLYQIRSLLEQGKRLAMLNYRYFRVRLKLGQQTLLKEHFEEAWCEAKTNQGNLAPWIFVPPEPDSSKDSCYETIWRELVDLYPFVKELDPKAQSEAAPAAQEGA